MEIDKVKAGDKRREQVRRAQKSHRDRKVTYVKNLEAEVAELRSRNAALMKELAELRAGHLGALETKDITSSTDCTTGGHISSSSQVNVSMAGTVFPHQSVSLSYPDCLMPPNLERGADLTHPHVVLDFILSLEQPCIYHHKLPSPELLLTGSLGGTGHASMLSSPIMARAPAFSLNPLKFGLPPDAQWQVSLAELEQLLQASQKLDLDTEITPIQAWDCIRTHPLFNAFDASRLDQLRVQLLPLIKCHGFGAVMHRTTFDETLQEFCEKVLIPLE